MGEGVGAPGGMGRGAEGRGYGGMRGGRKRQGGGSNGERGGGVGRGDRAIQLGAIVVSAGGPSGGGALALEQPGIFQSRLLVSYTSLALPSPSVVSRVPPVVALIPADTTVIHQGVEEHIQGTINAQLDNDPFNNIFTLEPSSKESSSRDFIPSNLHQANQPIEHLSKWTKNCLLNNVIGNPSRPVSTRRQLQTDAMWCYFDAFLTKVEPKNIKEALKESSWIEAMQEEIHEFDRL
ncbi:hypothetical protein Tco_0429729 [Tanacetum coccineum]